MRYTLAPILKCDLEAIAEWIAQDSPRRAIKVGRELRAELGKIAMNPMLYQLRPDIGEDVRLAAVGRYVILFSVDGNTVRFERVVYGGRDLPSLYQEAVGNPANRTTGPVSIAGRMGAAWCAPSLLSNHLH